jgi:hypothetical protein
MIHMAYAASSSVTFSTIPRPENGWPFARWHEAKGDFCPREEEGNVATQAF